MILEEEGTTVRRNVGPFAHCRRVIFETTGILRCEVMTKAETLTFIATHNLKPQELNVIEIT